MGMCEVTWNEFELFMYPEDEKRLREEVGGDPYTDKLSDAVTRPSKPYTEMSFGMGKDGYPAISMTQHAANKYCQWLSAKTGHFYRMPTEAEWEYAARAGGDSPYDFGSPDKLRQYAWFAENAEQQTHVVAQKKPNRWGLCDMYGNVSEWCEDVYSPTAYKDGPAVDPHGPPSPGKDVQRVLRGGNWQSSAEKCRASFRQGARTGNTDACFSSDFCGFRCVRRASVEELAQLTRPSK